MDASRMYLGIDLGATMVKLGIVDERGMVLDKTSFSASDLVSDAQCLAFVDAVTSFVHGVGVYSSELAGIGLAVPGIVADGVPALTANISADWPRLLDSLRPAFSQCPITCVNDANAAALGELWLGAAEGARSVLLVTIGTGIGAGLVLDGRVVTGHNGAAGEIGHLTVAPGGRPCGCGRAGCLEQYASARGIVANFWEADRAGIPASSARVPAHAVDALAVFDAARAGDERARAALQRFSSTLGFALAQVTCVVDSEVILLGGGVAGGADLYLDDLRAAYGTSCLSTCASTDIRCATLGNDGGVVGAVRCSMLAEDAGDR